MLPINKIVVTSFCALSLSATSFAQPRQKLVAPIHSLVSVIENKEDVSITTTLEKAQYSGDEDVKMTIALKNTGAKPLYISTDAIENFYQIEVTGPDGNKVDRKQPEQLVPRINGMLNPLGALNDYSVPSGQTKSSLVWLSNIFDMSRSGTYKISVNQIFQSGKNPGELVTIKTEPVTINVTSGPTLSEWLN